MQITTLAELGTAALEGKRVVVPEHPIFQRPHTAVHISHKPASRIEALIKQGMFIYTPKRP